MVNKRIQLGLNLGIINTSIYNYSLCISILYNERPTFLFYCREIQQGAFQKSYRPPWIRKAAPWLSNQYLLVACIVVVIAFIFMYSRWLGRMQTSGGGAGASLRRVPTMAYFMTEEGQVQEGVYEMSVWAMLVIWVSDVSMTSNVRHLLRRKLLQW